MSDFAGFLFSRMNELIIISILYTSGGPNLIAGWYRNGKMIDSREEYRMHHGYFYHLQLRSLSRNHHRATYTCQLRLDVTPPVPPIARNVTLNIRSKPCKILIDYWYINAVLWYGTRPLKKKDATVYSYPVVWTTNIVG